jgi:hypothetical protein
MSIYFWLPAGILIRIWRIFEILKISFQILATKKLTKQLNFCQFFKISIWRNFTKEKHLAHVGTFTFLKKMRLPN